MNLAEADITEPERGVGSVLRWVEADMFELERRVGFALQDREHSEIEPAEGARDIVPQLWLQALDREFRAVAGAGAAPVWIYDTFKWGPHDWPVRWRDVPVMRYTDCGLMAALSTEVYRWRGTFAAPVQLVLKFNGWSTLGWANLWRTAALPAHWCDGDYAYHEVTGVAGRGGELRLWDALGRFWMPAPVHETYEGIVALRIDGDPQRIARIGGQRLRSGRWYALPPESVRKLGSKGHDEARPIRPLPAMKAA